MAFSLLAPCILAFVPTLSEASSSFLQQASRSHALASVFAGVRYSRQDPAARTLMALDTDQNGRIDPDEVASFAHSQGLDAEAATQEFSTIDANGDGTLDATELQQVLGASPAAKPIGAEQADVVEPPVAVAALSHDGEVHQVNPIGEVAGHAAAAPVSETPLLQASAEAGSGSAMRAPSVLISDASRASVRMAAQKVAEGLALEEKEEAAARELDRQASEVRANATALTKATVRDALSAGANAAHLKANELMANISKLEAMAQKAEVRAAALTAKSKLEIEQGKELMTEADRALKQIPNGRI